MREVLDSRSASTDETVGEIVKVLAAHVMLNHVGVDDVAKMLVDARLDELYVVQCEVGRIVDRQTTDPDTDGDVLLAVLEHIGRRRGEIRALADRQREE